MEPFAYDVLKYHDRCLREDGKVTFADVMEYSLTKPEFAIPPPPTQRTRVRRFIKRFKPSPDSPAPACAQCLDDPEQNGHIVAEPAAADVGTMIRTSVEDSTAQEDEQNDPYNNAHDDGHVDSEPITEVQANTDEDERVRAELSIKSLEMEHLDIAAKVLGDMTLNAVMQVLFAARSDVVYIEPTKHAVMIDGSLGMD
ncbi:hypothetical protein PC112_g3670 [Phytophthora cactorum]|nr:hypothetical protein PC112_g3670 [Phytophthora cactorum]